MRKFVFIGTESTGKSTLCARVAGHLGIPWAAEQARAYLEHTGGKYVASDLLRIARLQAAAEDALAQLPVALCDTDLHVIRVWSEHRFGRCDRFILEQLAARRCDHYFLCAPFGAWVPDPLREYPDPAARHYFHNVYADVVQQSGVPFTVLEGPEDARFQRTLQALAHY